MIQTAETRPRGAARRAALWGVLLCVAVAGAAALPAQTLNSIYPRGARPGDELEVTFYGRGLRDTVGVVSFQEGLGFELLPPEKGEEQRDDRVKFRITVAEDCLLGAQLLMVHTERGVSRAGTFHIGPLPVVAEEEDHESFADAQLAEPNVTLEGRLEREDTDWYAFEVEAGQRLVFEVQALRLGDSGIDVELEIYDAERRLLVRADDSVFGMTDPVVAHTFEQAGRVVARLRDVASGGSSSSFYRLHVGDFPRPVGAVPVGGPPGETVPMKLLEPDGMVRQVDVEIPADPAREGATWPEIDGRVPPTPLRVAASGLPVVVEGAERAEDAAPPAAPVALHGLIAEPGESDRFEVTLTKGDRLSIRSVSRRYRSPIDAVVWIANADGKTLSANDDSGGPDSVVRYRVPDDGVYQVGIRDLLRRGGPDYFYRVEVAREGSSLVVRQSVPGRYPEDCGVAVPRGGRTVTVVSATGLDRDAGIRLGFEGLPAGVTASVPTFVKGADVVPVVFEAAEDAPLAMGLATPTATAATAPEERRVVWRHGIPLVRVRNQQVMIGSLLRELPVAVAGPAPFRIEAEAPQVPIVRGAPMRLPFVVHRDEGFDATVTIRVVWAPPGLSTGTGRLGKGKTEGSLYLSARGNAALGTWPIVLAATADIGGVRREVASAILPLEICDPWIGVAAPRVQFEQGTDGVFALKLEKRREFEGTLRIVPQRLPKGVTLKLPETIDPAAGTVEVPLEIAADAQLGRHRRQYLQVYVTSPGGEVLHHVGGGEIRVDRPLPPELRGDANEGGGRP